MQTINDFFRKQLLGFWKWLEKSLKPPIVFSYQTLILLSIYSLALGILTTGFTNRAIIACGWMFFLLGTAWALNEKPIRIGSFLLNFWIIAVLICVFIFGYILEDLFQPELWVTLPLIVILITTINEFTNSKLQFQLPSVAIRQKIITQWAVHLLISCWMQFFIVVNDIIEGYPVLVREDFGNSVFVNKLPFLPAPKSRGEVALEFVTTVIKERFNNQSWQTVESLLEPTNRKQWIGEIWQEFLPANSDNSSIINSNTKENNLWEFTTSAIPENNGYLLALIAEWQGPRAGVGKISFVSNCEIQRAIEPSSEPSTELLVRPLGEPFINNSPNSGVPEGTSPSKIECRSIEEVRRNS
ncbi:MAG: DUF5357 domain-containing protein [Coleofasciculaceae cyanobacterium SM2_1_6]|nr:DUF5357 domain-containing protein [Coleofasciculaceae cyanobacterium SM2_1_6]